ncbi:MAG: hypothetical protein ACYC1M_14830 [Armatimonadota bacterium]
MSSMMQLCRMKPVDFVGLLKQAHEAVIFEVLPLRTYNPQYCMVYVNVISRWSPGVIGKTVLLVDDVARGAFIPGGVYLLLPSYMGSSWSVNSMSYMAAISTDGIVYPYGMGNSPMKHQYILKLLDANGRTSKKDAMKHRDGLMQAVKRKRGGVLGQLDSVLKKNRYRLVVQGLYGDCYMTNHRMLLNADGDGAGCPHTDHSEWASVHAIGLNGKGVHLQLYKNNGVWRLLELASKRAGQV